MDTWVSVCPSFDHEIAEITKKQLTNQKHLCIIIKVWLGENYVD